MQPDGTPFGPVRVVGTDLKIQPGPPLKYTFKDTVAGTFPPSEDYTFVLYMGKMGNGTFVSHGFSFSKKEYLAADPRTVPEAGGSVVFELFSEPMNAYRNYLLLGSVSGTSPGTPLPGGSVILPLNWDTFTSLVVLYANTPIFHDFLGVLDSQGSGKAQLNLGPVPGYAGSVLYFAYALNKPWDFVSNPVKIEIVP
jgi:hypothetical protein